MPIKKSKDDWASEPAEKASGQIGNTGGSGGPRRQSLKIPFAVRIPAELYDTMKDYIENHAKAGESINEIFMTGAEAEMQKRLARAGKNIDNKTRKKNAVAGIREYLKDIEDIEC